MGQEIINNEYVLCSLELTAIIAPTCQVFNLNLTLAELNKLPL